MVVVVNNFILVPGTIAARVLPAHVIAEVGRLLCFDNELVPNANLRAAVHAFATAAPRVQRVE